MQDWTIWRQWLRTLCINDIGTWEEPLGQWSCHQEEWTSIWDCFIDQTTECLYIRSMDGLRWSRHLIQENRDRHRHCYYIESLLYNTIPDNLRTLRRVSVKGHCTHMEVMAISKRTTTMDNTRARLTTVDKHPTTEDQYSLGYSGSMPTHFPRCHQVTWLPVIWFQQWHHHRS
jgi:hypothetical protein